MLLEVALNYFSLAVGESLTLGQNISALVHMLTFDDFLVAENLGTSIL